MVTKGRKRELAKDEWVTSTLSLWQWIVDRKKIFYPLVSLIFLCGISYVAYLNFQQNQFIKASETLIQAKSSEDYQKIIEKYSGTGSAAIALKSLAQEAMVENKWQEALNYLNQFSSEYQKHPLIQYIQIQIGFCMEKLNKYGELDAFFDELVQNYQSKPQETLILMSYANSLFRRNQAQKALLTYQKVIKFDDSVWKLEAEKRVQQLS